MKRSQHILTTALLLAALALSGPAAWAVRKTVTYTFTAEKVDGKSEARKLTFTPSRAMAMPSTCNLNLSIFYSA